MSKRISRSTFLKGMAGAAAGLLPGPLLFEWSHSQRQIPCRLLGPSKSIGHMLRDGLLGNVPANAPEEQTTVAIIGGGMAGLSAAWWLKKQGFSNYRLLELEQEVGGNSRSGKNQISEYPWGAHYVPLANAESDYVRELFQELGIIEGLDERGLPVYNELYLCHEPQQRLLKDGVFQEGMVPNRGLQPQDKEQMARFFDLIKKYRLEIGQDGKPAFAIPLDLSSHDQRFIALDDISFSTWLHDSGFNSVPLLWYLNYCCRDDYGATADNVSAWAGIHYFAGRRGTGANAEMNAVLTWPEGNGFLVKKLKQTVGEHITTGSVVAKIAQSDEGMTTSYFQPETKQWRVLKSKMLICAAPRFVAGHIIESGSTSEGVDSRQLSYAPWLVANVSVRRVPTGRGASLCWDNVQYNSPSLGYVVATHQNITTREGNTVITYYYPLSNMSALSARGKLYSAGAQEWSNMIIGDLEKMHPGISDEILSVDIWPWGHGMISPAVGFIWGDNRRKMKENQGKIFFAHSDMSGMSNFEEAQYQGVTAASNVLTELELT